MECFYFTSPDEGDALYLKETVAEPLMECLAELLIARPHDPIEFIGIWLHHYLDKEAYLARQMRLHRDIILTAAEMAERKKYYELKTADLRMQIELIKGRKLDLTTDLVELYRGRMAICHLEKTAKGQELLKAQKWQLKSRRLHSAKGIIDREADGEHQKGKTKRKTRFGKQSRFRLESDLGTEDKSPKRSALIRRTRRDSSGSSRSSPLSASSRTSSPGRAGGVQQSHVARRNAKRQRRFEPDSQGDDSRSTTRAEFSGVFSASWRSAQLKTDIHTTDEDFSGTSTARRRNGRRKSKTGKHATEEGFSDTFTSSRRSGLSKSVRYIIEEEYFSDTVAIIRKRSKHKTDRDATEEIDFLGTVTPRKRQARIKTDTDTHEEDFSGTVSPRRVHERQKPDRHATEKADYSGTITRRKKHARYNIVGYAAEEKDVQGTVTSRKRDAGHKTDRYAPEEEEEEGGEEYISSKRIAHRRVDRYATREGDMDTFTSSWGSIQVRGDRLPTQQSLSCTELTSWRDAEEELSRTDSLYSEEQEDDKTGRKHRRSSDRFSRRKVRHRRGSPAPGSSSGSSGSVGYDDVSSEGGDVSPTDGKTKRKERRGKTRIVAGRLDSQREGSGTFSDFYSSSTSEATGCSSASVCPASWYLDEFSKLVCSHPLLGTIGAPQRRFYDAETPILILRPQDDFARENLYDPELFVTCNMWDDGDDDDERECQGIPENMVDGEDVKEQRFPEYEEEDEDEDFEQQGLGFYDQDDVNEDFEKDGSPQDVWRYFD